MSYYILKFSQNSKEKKDVHRKTIMREIIIKRKKRIFGSDWGGGA